MTVDTPTTTPPVDWDAVEEEIYCPLCDYNLRGLIEPRCPECGSRYTWKDLFDPRRRKHPYLFEHHPERNWRSFWQTLKGGLKPKQFWKALHPIQPSNIRRLLVYQFSVAILFLIGSTASEYIQWLCRRIPIFSLYSEQDRSLTDYLSYWWDQTGWFQFVDSILQIMMYLVWVAMTYLSLLIFQQSMRKARIKGIHVIRCVIYSADAALLFCMVSFVIGIMQSQRIRLDGGILLQVWVAIMIPLTVIRRRFTTGGNTLRESLLTGFTRLIGWIGPAVLLIWITESFLVLLHIRTTFSPDIRGSLPLWGFVFVMSYRLVYAYRSYLQFDHPIAVIVASQLVTMELSMGIAYVFREVVSSLV